MNARCRCGARHGADAFARLPPVRRLDADELRDIVVRWPAGLVVDVRACDACGAEIARLGRREASD